MKSIERLRKMDDEMLVPLGNGQYVPDHSHNDIADEIEAEIAERYIKSDYDLKVCGTCAAFGMQFQHGQGVDSNDDGACRMFPPQNIAIGSDGEFATLFPSVNVEDWCLSWTPKGVSE